MTEQEQADDLDVVWQNTLDDRTWACRIIRTEPYQGQLTVWNIASGAIILNEPVRLAFDAIFGPDVADLAEWQEQIIAAIDAHNQSGETS